MGAMETTTRQLETVVEARDLDALLRFFCDELGCRIELVTPADDPSDYVVVGHGARFRLRRSAADVPVMLRLDGDAARRLVAPNGSVVEIVERTGDILVPDAVPTLTVTAAAGDFGVGRAGMTYRDLLPDRWGGRFIASHIRIDSGGDVADWVHFHRIRFQMIFVAAGWVDVVYEDQGAPFRMHAGDCVLQPPEIRHRVLRSSPGLEVIEVGCPAVHDTIADHDLELPTAEVRPDRDFGGQRFVRHTAAGATTQPWVVPGLRARDTGIGDATAGLAGAVVVSADASSASDTPVRLLQSGEFALVVGLGGAATLDIGGHGRVPIGPRCSVALPPGTSWSWTDIEPDHEALVVSVGADAIQPG